jgi:hypothetical protein
LTDGRKAVHHRHLQIHQDHIERRALKRVNRLGAILDTGQLHAEIAQDQFYNPAIAFVVVGQQDAKRTRFRFTLRFGCKLRRPLIRFLNRRER